MDENSPSNIVPEREPASRRASDAASIVESKLSDEHSIDYPAINQTAEDPENSQAAIENEFVHRFEKHLNKGDFLSARQLLDLGRHTYISENRYHYERLRLHLAQNDVEAFYKYYNDVKARTGFDPDLQTRIANLLKTLDAG